MVLVISTYIVFARPTARFFWAMFNLILFGHFVDREAFIRRQVWSARIVGGAMVAIGLAAIATHVIP